MYYILRCPPITNDKGELLVEINNHESVGDVWDWGMGDVFSQDEIQSIPRPIHINIESFRGYNGLPNEMRDIGVCVMSKRLSEVLIQAGIDNIDYYPAVLTDATTGQKYEYLAYNLIGKVASADLSKSNYTNYDSKLTVDVGFKDLVIDESKTKGLLIFRLAENLSTILVHDSVRKLLVEKGIDTLKFVKPEDYMHL
jgi:hypothetical protein